MTFHVGQKVVCVDASPPRHGFALHRLQLGKLYLIRGFDPESKVGLYLEGLLDPTIIPPWQHEFGWCVSRFRPVVEKNTDISIFTAMLTPSGRKLETVMTDDASSVRSPGIESEKPIAAGTPA